MSIRRNASLLLFLILYLLAYACSDGPLDPPPTNECIWPMSMGNEWVYQITDHSPWKNRVDTSRFRVSRDKIIDNERWFFIGSYESCCNRADGLWCKNEKTKNINLIAKYPANTGDIFISVNGDTAYVTAVNKPVTVPSGTFSCYEYDIPSGFWPPTMTMGHPALWQYCPGVGLIRTAWYSEYDGRVMYSRELISYSVAD